MDRFRFKKAAAFLLVFMLVMDYFHITVLAEDIQYRMNVTVSVNGNETGSIAALDSDYENNLYISLKGLAYCLQGTDKAFSAAIDKKKIEISIGNEYQGGASFWSDEELSKDTKDSAHKYELYLNGNEKKYYSFIFACGDGYDAFLTPASLAMMFDFNMRVTDGRVEIDTSTPYFLSMDEVENSGYMQDVNSLVTGDGTTGAVYYGYHQDEPFPIASTTKLMTYYILMDAVSQGKCSLDDMVIISERAERLSESPDGVVPMKAGISVPVRELVYGMLLPSSNECAYLVAEYVAGSHDAFVEMMNEKAEELGLTSAEFYNSHGLPSYDDQFVPAKMQNLMSAEDLFKLSSAIMNEYPQIAEITSVKSYHLDYLGKDIKNTNALLYNMDNAVGLKTGTTSKAGACLVTCVKMDLDGQTHNLITVLLGADEDSGRGLISEMASRYSMNVINGNADVFGSFSNGDLDGSGGDLGGSFGGGGVDAIPDDPEAVVKKILKIAGKK